MPSIGVVTGRLKGNQRISLIPADFPAVACWRMEAEKSMSSEFSIPLATN